MTDSSINRQTNTITLQNETSWQTIFFLLGIRENELLSPVSSGYDTDDEGDEKHKFGLEFPNLLAMLNGFERTNKDAKLTFVDTNLSDDSIEKLDRFIYVVFSGQMNIGETYNIIGFLKDVNSRYEKQGLLDQERVRVQKEKDKMIAAQKRARAERLHTNVEQILTKVDVLEMKINLIIQSLDTPVSVGGSKKKRKYRTKKR